ALLGMTCMAPPRDRRSADPPQYRGQQSGKLSRERPEVGRGDHDVRDRGAVHRRGRPGVRRGVPGRLHLRRGAGALHPPGRVRRLRGMRAGLPGRGDLLRGRPARAVVGVHRRQRPVLRRSTARPGGSAGHARRSCGTGPARRGHSTGRGLSAAGRMSGPAAGPPATAVALASTQRRRLFELLDAADAPTDAHELAAATGLHVTTVRHHLDVLHRAGLVESHSLRRASVGRPRTVYTAVRNREPSDYPTLTRLLASQLADSPEERVARSEKAGLAWAAELMAGADPGPATDLDAAARVVAG